MGIVMMIVVGSCQKNEFEYENVSGILTFRFQLLDGRVFDCTVDQPAKTIQNDLDSLLFGTSSATLAKIKPIFTTTMELRFLLMAQKSKVEKVKLILISQSRLQRVSKMLSVNIL